MTDSSRKPRGHLPVQLRLRRNGQQGGHAQAFTVTMPNITNTLKTRCMCRAGSTGLTQRPPGEQPAVGRIPAPMLLRHAGPPSEDSHSRAHRKLNKKRSPFRYPWQQSLEHPEDNGIPSSKGEGFTSMGLYNKHRLQQRQERVPQAHRQQFEFREGQIVSFGNPELVLGVKAIEGARAGKALQLLRRNPHDTNQRWILREEDR
ncbi:hypothetical protein AAFF_G00382510 [Aldrovandia affinis]|uniref:Uncharacterized protein n=1 Tax=Aldrovandia affinis TaxID=143900 RepID=A0AAD7T885_9TELE|nr:hypothetical protein AAFF_G00382510 [Aldrovandia affinis]